MPQPSAPENQWEPAIQEFERQDRVAPPPRGATLFVGSSSIARWDTLQQDFPFASTLQRGFGGSRLDDSVHFADRIIIPYAPGAVVVYAGDNDLASGESPKEVAADFKALVRKVRDALGRVPTAFIAIKPSPARWHLDDQIRRANRLVADWTAGREALTCIDVYLPMLNALGRPRAELYVEDGLHLSRAGYRLWTAVLTPWLQSVMCSP